MDAYFGHQFIRIMRFLLFICLLFIQSAFCQTSTFDTDNEGWSADDDAQNNEAYWISSGGFPDGFIQAIDGADGFTWYFIASDAYKGVKCDAYGRFLRYDQIVSSNSIPNNLPDVELKGNGITLVFNNPVLPGTEWTHFDLLIREDAGWRLNTLNGAVPTAAQVKKLLCNVTSIRIRGEYLSGADDVGGLDNVVLESNSFFEFDLDGDDSSGAANGDFQAQATCIPNSKIVDSDALLHTLAGIDSVVVHIAGGAAGEELSLDILVGGVMVAQDLPDAITLVNGGTASTEDFITLLQNIQYFDNRFDPPPGVRVIDIEVFTDCCGAVESHRAYLPIYIQPDAGISGDTVLCYGSGLLDLRTVLKGDPDFNGAWEPPLHSGGNLFDPSLDSAGVYTYILPEAQPCSGDSAQVSVAIQYPFQLRPDTTVCFDETLLISVPPGLVSWTWNDGTHKLQLPVDEPGTFSLLGSTAYCTFQDSVAVDFYSCSECPPYAPNVFSPNDDGNNDEWHVFLNCRWTAYRLEVYDRWGSLVFRSSDPESAWDGRVHGKEAPAGVYVWRMEWTGELFNVPKSWRFEGDVTIFR